MTSRRTSRTARDLLSQAEIGLDNCTPAEHALIKVLQGVGFAILSLEGAIDEQTDRTVNQ
jgi:hypothetical protein